MSLIDLVNEMEEKMFGISKNIEKELNTVIIKGKINNYKTMKTILIKGAQGSGKTTLAHTIGGVILDGLFHDNGVETLVSTAKSKLKENIIVCTQNENFNEKGFDLVFRLKNK